MRNRVNVILKWFFRKYVWHNFWEEKTIFKNSKGIITHRIFENTSILFDKYDSIELNYCSNTGKFKSFNRILKKEK